MKRKNENEEGEMNNKEDRPGRVEMNEMKGRARARRRGLVA